MLLNFLTLSRKKTKRAPRFAFHNWLPCDLSQNKQSLSQSKQDLFQSKQDLSQNKQSLSQSKQDTQKLNSK